MKKIFYTPIEEKDEFGKYGDTFKFVTKNENTGLYLYQRTGKDNGWEVIKPKRVTQPDGTEVYVYPSAEDFGQYGLCFNSKEWAYKCLELGFEGWREWKAKWREEKNRAYFKKKRGPINLGPLLYH